MNWAEEKKHLTEQLEILRELRNRFGDEVIEKTLKEEAFFG